MYKKFFVCVLIALAAVIYAQEEVDHSLHCHHPTDDSIHLHVGESATLKGKCIKVTCVNHTTDHLEQTLCPPVKPAPNCHVTEEDLSKEFPDCCPKIKC